MAGDEDRTANPGGMFADEGNAKSRDWVQGAGMGGTKAQEHADRRGKGGKGPADSDGPIEGETGPRGR